MSGVVYLRGGESDGCSISEGRDRGVVYLRGGESEGCSLSEGER